MQLGDLCSVFAFLFIMGLLIMGLWTLFRDTQ